MVHRLVLGFILCVLFAAVFPAAADAASLYLSPSSGTYTVGDSFSVSLGVNTDGVAINAAQATVSFPNDILEVTSLDQSGIFTLWPVSPSYSNASGTITFAGGLPSPGYTGSGGTIITITFLAKVAGTATVTIGSASVLANDGFGTNVLTSSGSGTYVVGAVPEPEPEPEPEPQPEPEPEPEPDLPDAPTITSPTHPEQALWYSDFNPALNWTTEASVLGFSYSLDDQAGVAPDTIQDTTDTTVMFSGIADGIWYFHVRARNVDGWGPAAHYTIQIDTTPPAPFDIELLDGKRTKNRTPRISFETTDEHSGVHHYDLSVDGGAAVDLDIGSTISYALSELKVGKHRVVARAFDYASNNTSSSANFDVIETGGTTTTVEDVEEEKPAIVEFIERIEDALPEPIRKLTERIGTTIRDLRQNDVITDLIDTVAEPWATTGAIVAITGIAATTSAFQLTNLFYLLLRFSYFWIVPIHVGKRKKAWGTVFDSTTGMPVKGAIVRIFSREFNKMRESQITDEQGRFGFLVDPGQYYVTVIKMGYVFPSHFMQTAAISQYTNVYRGDTLGVKERKEGVLTINIPLDPNTKTVTKMRLAWLRFINSAATILNRVSLPLLITGTFLSWISLIIDPVKSNFIVLGLYGGLIFLKYLVGGLLERSWGIVEDAETKEPIGLVVVRIYDVQTGRIIGTRVSNSQGQFTALVPPGKYYLVAVKTGYEPFKSKPIGVSKRQGLIRIKVELKPKTADTPPLPEVKDEVVKLESIDETPTAQVAQKIAPEPERSEQPQDKSVQPRKRAKRKSRKK